MSEPVRFENDRGLKLAGLLDGDGPRGVIVCSHFVGFKEVKLYYYLARALAEAGLTALRFDYGDCIGASGGSCDEMSVTHQVQDTRAALDFLADREIQRLGIFGHSLGGLTAVAAASVDSRVNALVTAAAPAHPDWDEAFRDLEPRWREQGFIMFPEWRKGQVRIPYSFYQDLSLFDGSSLVRKIEAPIRIIHPGADETVALRHAEALYAHAGEPRDLQIIPEADHLFSSHERMEVLLTLSIDWFTRHL